MKLISIILLLFSLLSLSMAQVNNSSHPFSGSFVISGEGGITIGMTDFTETKIDYLGRGSLEYFFSTSSPSVFGVRLLAGGGFIAGKGLVTNDPRYLNIDEFQTKIVYGGAGFIYSYSLGKVLQPYIFGGASYLIFNPLRTDGIKMPRNTIADYAKEEIDYMGEFGIRFLISRTLSLNIGYTFNYLNNDNLDDVFSSENDVFHSFFGGLSYYLLSSADSDSDGDGVKDKKDLCQDTPIGVEVDEFGCPLDSDNDKVPDFQDLCAGTPLNVPVDSSGCPKDSDNDGIVDYLDQCPDSQPGIEVDSVGCERVVTLEEAVEMEDEIVGMSNRVLVLGGTANFKSGESKLLSNPKSGLEKLCEYMLKNPDLYWIIEGHSDNIGNEKNNLKLSLERAKSVLSYFLKKGIKENRFEVLAAGSSKPVADNSVEFGRALNRRVVIEEKNSYYERKKMMTPIKFEDYDYSKEYNIESLIFTDGKYFSIQVSSWKKKESAEKEFNHMIQKGHPAFIVESEDAKLNEKWFRVRIGYFDNIEGARQYLKLIR